MASLIRRCGSFVQELALALKRSSRCLCLAKFHSPWRAAAGDAGHVAHHAAQTLPVKPGAFMQLPHPTVLTFFLRRFKHRYPTAVPAALSVAHHLGVARAGLRLYNICAQENGSRSTG